MPPLRLYLDTSVINFLFADDAPEKRDVTIRLFQLIREGGRFEAFSSSVAVEEVQQTRDADKRAALLSVFDANPIVLIDRVSLEPAVSRLANAYLYGRVLPEKSREDALHVAIATLFGCNRLVSWNFRHLANKDRQKLFSTVNRRLGHEHTPHLLTPEVLLAS